MRRFLILSLNNDPTDDLGTVHAGGQTKYVLELTKNLLFHGHSVEVITIGKVDQPAREEFVPGAYVSRFFRSSGSSYDYDITAAELESISDDILVYVKNNEFPVDILICCYWTAYSASEKLQSAIGCPLIVSFCQLAAFKQQGANPGELKIRFEKERKLGMLADAVIATSPTEKQILVSEYELPEDKIHVIPRGINLSVFYP